jgi:hypothetical protein
VIGVGGAGEAVTILHPGPASKEPRLGTPVAGPPTPEVVEGCLVAPGDTRETSVGQSTVGVEFTIYMPAGRTVEPTAKMIVRGGTYEVDGEAKHWGAGTVVAVGRAR